MFYLFILKGIKSIKVFNLIVKYLLFAIIIYSLFTYASIHIFDLALGDNIVVTLQSLSLVVFIVIALIAYIKKYKINNLRTILER